MIRIITISILLLSVTKAAIAQQHDSLLLSKQRDAQQLKEKTSKTYASLSDSINPKKRIKTYRQRLSKIQARLSGQIDSLKKTPNPSPSHARTQDSLVAKLDSIKNAGPVDQLQDAEAKLSKLENNVQGKLTNVQAKISSKFAGVADKLPGGAAPSGLSSSSISLPKVPGIQIPGVGAPALPQGTGTLSLPQTTGLDKAGTASIPGVPGLNTGSADGLTNTISTVEKDALGNAIPSSLTKESSDIMKSAGAATRYENDIAKVKNDGLAGADLSSIESKAGGLSEIKELKTETLSEEQFLELKKKWEADPDYAMEMAMSKAKNQAIDHFAGHTQEVQAVVQKMAGYKAKLHDAEQTFNLMGKGPSPLKTKAWFERMRPEFVLQFQKSGNIWLDVAPLLGYRFTTRLTTGIGWNERLAYQTKSNRFIHQDRVYGARIFGQYKISEGFYGRLELERMNAYVHSSFYIPAENTGRRWVNSYFAGIKKEFRYSKSILGNVQVLYNLYNPLKISPYATRISLRIGFEFCLSTKQKKPIQTNSANP